MKAPNLYSRALQFSVDGYSIMPVGKDKKPLLPSWKLLQTSPADDNQIEKWWDKFPQANIGIITGKVSGISVIDVDTYHGGDHTQFPPTFTVRTGNGGYHLYYKYHPGLSISAGAYPQFPGVDIRSDGGFVVGPYSTTAYRDKEDKLKGGSYEIIDGQSLQPFPAHLFPAHKPHRKLSTLTGVSSGSRNDSITSFIGTLLHSAPDSEWESEVWPSVERANKTYTPPLPSRELRNTFESIVKKELERRSSMIVSPMQLSTGEQIEVSIRKNKAGTAYKDMANVLAVLTKHPYYKDTLRYNDFRQEIEYNGRPFEDGDLVKIQYFMQTEAELHGIAKEAVYAAVQHYANQQHYDEAKDWLATLTWDKKKRLHEWIYRATGVANTSYHAGIGAQWFSGIVRRIMQPGCIFDYVLVLVGPQGIGKTSLFRIIGGPWYKSYTGAIDNKDFYLALRGAVIVDLDEGAALSRSDAIKIKSVITDTHDEYRAPYDRLMKKYPRRFVFSMSTNDTEPFRDMTGNRRYWTIDGETQVDFKWLEENRDQLYAEAYEAWKNGTKLSEVPYDEALLNQEAHLPEDSWTDRLMEILRKAPDYCRGSVEYFTTTADLYTQMFPDEDLSRLGRSQEMRISGILKRIGFESKRIMIEGERKNRWLLTPKRATELAAKPDPDSRDMFDLYEPK